MEFRQVSDTLSVGIQIVAAEVSSIKAAGFRSIICNRPDGEGADQPPFAEITEAAGAAGLEARYIPVVPGAIAAGDVEAFATALRELPGPVLAYCRTGARSAMLADMARAPG